MFRVSGGTIAQRTLLQHRPSSPRAGRVAGAPPRAVHLRGATECQTTAGGQHRIPKSAAEKLKRDGPPESPRPPPNENPRGARTRHGHPAPLEPRKGRTTQLTRSHIPIHRAATACPGNGNFRARHGLGRCTCPGPGTPQCHQPASVASPEGRSLHQPLSPGWKEPAQAPELALDPPSI